MVEQKSQKKMDGVWSRIPVVFQRIFLLQNCGTMERELVLHFAIGVGPLAVYLLLVGWINLWRKPFLTTGGRDTAAMGIALVGLALIGPMTLFKPSSAATLFHGGLVWLLLLCFYGLCVSLVILLMRPRLVIYNADHEQFMPTLRRLALQLDRESRWAGESLALPNLGIQLYVDNFPVLNNVQLVATGSNQSFEGWLKLEKELGGELGTIKSTPSVYGGVLVAISLVALTGMTVWMFMDKNGVLTAINDMTQ